MISINPSNYDRSYLVSKIEIHVVQLILGSSVTLLVKCYDDNGSFLLDQSLELFGEEYLAWGSDDSYILDKVMEKMNFSLVAI